MTKQQKYLQGSRAKFKPKHVDSTQHCLIHCPDGVSAATLTFGENAVNAAAQLLDSSMTSADADNNFNGGTLVLSGRCPKIRHAHRHLNGDATSPAIEAPIENLTYANGSDTPRSRPRVTTPTAPARAGRRDRITGRPLGTFALMAC